jgi:hypothetical protein
MRKLFSMMGLFSVYLLMVNLGCIVLYVLYFEISANDTPAPKLSDSYSFNEKMEFLRTAKIDADIIAIGSSMSLNNLHSKTITDELHSTSFLNTGSWGMSMKDDFLLLKVLSEIHKPSTVIIASNTHDFSQRDKKINYSSLKHFLLSDNNFIHHMKNFNLKYYFENFRYAKKVRSSTNEYEYLGFDKHGTVNFDSANFKINVKRWNSDNLNSKTLSHQYSFLDSISIFCKSKNIKLLFFQSPYRNGLYSTFDDKKLNNLKSHIEKIEVILKQNNGIFINANEVIWADHFFTDATHFNKFGAKKFTEYCLYEHRKSTALVEKSKQQTSLESVCFDIDR